MNALETLKGLIHVVRSIIIAPEYGYKNFEKG